MDIVMWAKTCGVKTKIPRYYGIFIEKPFALLNFPLMWEIINYAPPTLQSPLVEWPGIQNPREKPMTCGLEYVSCPLQFFFYYNSKDPRRTLAVNYVGIESYKCCKLATE